MDNKNANQLARLPYTSIVSSDETTNGRPIYFAQNPELRGCIAQGNTPDESLANLTDARIDYIESLLEDREPIPTPQRAISQSWST